MANIASQTPRILFSARVPNEMYSAEATTDQNALADRVAADVAAILAARPDVKVHCVQHAAPELRPRPSLA